MFCQYNCSNMVGYYFLRGGGDFLSSLKRLMAFSSTSHDANETKIYENSQTNLFYYVYNIKITTQYVLSRIVAQSQMTFRNFVINSEKNLTVSTGKSNFQLSVGKIHRIPSGKKQNENESIQRTGYSKEVNKEVNKFMNVVKIAIDSSHLESHNLLVRLHH